MTSFLLYTNIILLVYLSIFALFFVVISIVSLFSKTKKSVSDNIGNYSISILVPTLNEGEMLIDSLKSLLAQDYLNSVEIYVLLKNQNDSSLKYLKKEYGKEINSENGIVNIYNKSNFKINLVLSGLTLKKDKLNNIIPELKTDYVAIIDADHRPSKNWLKSSLSLFDSEKVAYVQTKRAPLDLATLPQIWDSVQNHGGNEVFNSFLSVIGKNVYFTGTAAIFKREILQEYLFSDSITEDTDLSYKILFDSFESRYNSKAISYEEVAPTLKSYILRRRRWSAGHSGVFIKNIRNIFNRNKKNKFINFFHGQFYFIPLVVFLILLLEGIHYFDQLALNQRLSIIIFTLILSWPLSLLSKSGNKLSVLEYFSSVIFLLPQITILSIFILSFSSWEGYYYLLSFPLAKEMSIWKTSLFLIPLLVIFVAYFKNKNVRKWRNLIYFITYPITLFFDIYAGFLGFIDLIFKRSVWTKIKRVNSYSSTMVDKEVAENLSAKRTDDRKVKKIFIFLLIFILSIFLVNDLMAVNNCGEIKKFIWKPLIIKPDADFSADIKIDKKIINESELLIEAKVQLSSLPENFQAKIYLDDQLFSEESISSNNYLLFSKNFLLGFESHSLFIDLNSKSNNSRQVCYRQIDISTSLKEIKNNSLYLNGEKFLIKGMIPSFLGNNISLNMEEGFKQLKKIGINTLRFYHSSNNKIREEAENNHLLIIDQPNESTWDNFNIFNDFQVNNFINRYKKTVKENQSSSFWLFTGIGNEWELKVNKDGFVKKIREIIIDSQKEVKNFPTTYSTYFTFINYPVDILGINMLDNGAVYWEGAIGKLKENKIVYYASEFGGFTAFLEKTVPEIRYNRIIKEWNILLDSGSIGANFYQSHDNWAQSIPMGYNDPNKAEHNDDVRGFWDEKNEEKIELQALKSVLSDIKIINDFESQEIKDCQEDFTFIFKNIREYKLKDVFLNIEGEDFYLGNFNSLEEKEFVFESRYEKDKKLNLLFSYTTHSGLRNYSQIDFQAPCFSNNIKIINEDFILRESQTDLVKGNLLSSSKLNFVIPKSYTNFYLNEKMYQNNQDYYSINIDGPYYQVVDLMYSRDKVNWQNFNQNSEIGGGLVYFKFKWPKATNYNTYLIIEGAGSDKISFELKYGKKDIAIHSYRENAIHISSLGKLSEGDEILFALNRNMIKYVDKRATANYQVPLIYEDDLMVEFKAPLVFSVNEFVIRK